MIFPGWLPAKPDALQNQATLPVGASLLRTGDTVRRFHFVVEGKLAAICYMPNGAEAVMLTARGGEFFAAASLFTPTYTCEA